MSRLFDRVHMIYYHSIATTALPILYRFPHIADHIGRKLLSLYTPTVFNALAVGNPVGILQRCLVRYWENYNDWATICWRKYDGMLSRFDTMPDSDRCKDRIPISVLMCWRMIKS